MDEKLEKLKEMLVARKEEISNIEIISIEGKKGEDGKSYVLTDQDKKEIANTIKVPIIEKEIETIIEKTETIVKEVPIVTENVVEKAMYEEPNQIISKINTGTNLIDNNRVKGLSELEKLFKMNAFNPTMGPSFSDLQGLSRRITVLESSPSGGGTWGSITGTLSNQTDLQAALDLKLNITSFTLAGISAGSLTTGNSLYTMTSTIPVEFITSGGVHLLYLDETNKRIGINQSLPGAQLDITAADATTGLSVTGTVGAIYTGAGAAPNSANVLSVVGAIGAENNQTGVGAKGARGWSVAISSGAGGVQSGASTGGGTSGGLGGRIDFTSGAGGAATGATGNAAGGAGGVVVFTGGTGGSTTATTGNGGTGGVFTFSAGSGGAKSAGTSGVGGAGGGFTMNSGNGGSTAAGTGNSGAGGGFTSTSGTAGDSFGGNGGNGGAVTFNSGAGGVSNKSGGGTSGNGGAFNFTAGAGGANSISGGTAGNGGSLTLNAGIAGTASGGATAGTKGSISIGTTNALNLTLGNTTDNTQIASNGTLVLRAGTATASTAPLKFQSGTSLTSAVAGVVEMTTDDLFFTITTGTARKRLLMADPVGGLSVDRIPFASTNGRLTDDASFKYSVSGGLVVIGAIDAQNLTVANPITMTNLTIGRVPYVGGSQQLTDDADFKFDGVDTLTITKISSGTITSTGTIILKGYTVAGLPAGTIGMTAYVTDALAPTFLATIVGGGAVTTPVFYNGANWVGY